jgi:hypothetical protein
MTMNEYPFVVWNALICVSHDAGPFGMRDKAVEFVTPAQTSLRKWINAGSIPSRQILFEILQPGKLPIHFLFFLANQRV